MEKNFGFGFDTTDELVDLATSYMWKQMVDLACAFVNETKVYKAKGIIKTTLGEYKEFTKNFDYAHIDLLTDEFWDWYDFHYANSEMLPSILNYFSAIIYAISSTRGKLEESYLDDLYDIYQRILPYTPPRYLA